MKNIGPTNVVSQSTPNVVPKSNTNVFLISNNINNSLAKTKTEIQKIESIQRNILSQSTIHTASSKRNLNSNDHSATSKSTAELAKTHIEFTNKLKINNSLNLASSLTQSAGSATNVSNTTNQPPLPIKTKSPPALTNLELKPATVEVYFRSSSGKTQKIEKKAIPTTIFPPPKINLKA